MQSVMLLAKIFRLMPRPPQMQLSQLGLEILMATMMVIKGLGAPAGQTSLQQ